MEFQKKEHFMKILRVYKINTSDEERYFLKCVGEENN